MSRKYVFPKANKYARPKRCPHCRKYLYYDSMLGQYSCLSPTCRRLEVNNTELMPPKGKHGRRK